jgi:ABC-type lipoprotein release transport system permease subunit
MGTYAEIARAGLVAVWLHPLRSFVTLACLLAALTPYIAATALSQGIQRDAEISVAQGADLYVGAEEFGRRVGVPLAWAPVIRAVDGVAAVTERIVGPVTLGKEPVHAVLVGVPREQLDGRVRCLEGRLFSAGASHELVLGSELARRLKLKAGDRIPPFYHSSQGDRVSEVVGVFGADVSLWEAQLIFTSLETAQAIFDQPRLATDLLVDCRPGYESAVRENLLRRLSAPAGDGRLAADEPGSRRLTPSIVTRDQLAELIERRMLHQGGVFNMLYALAFSVAILALLVTSGLGLSERRREIGILKALGWQTDEVLLRSFSESMCLCLLGASLAVVLAYIWLEWLNGFWIAGMFLAGVGVVPGFEIPFRLAPLAALLGLAVSFAIVASGTLYSSWRAAIASPRAAMG